MPPSSGAPSDRPRAPLVAASVTATSRFSYTRPATARSNIARYSAVSRSWTGEPPRKTNRLHRRRRIQKAYLLEGDPIPKTPAGRRRASAGHARIDVKHRDLRTRQPVAPPTTARLRRRPHRGRERPPERAPREQPQNPSRSSRRNAESTPNLDVIACSINAKMTLDRMRLAGHDPSLHSPPRTSRETRDQLWLADRRLEVLEGRPRWRAEIAHLVHDRFRQYERTQTDDSFGDEAILRHCKAGRSRRHDRDRPLSRLAYDSLGDLPIVAGAGRQGVHAGAQRRRRQPALRRHRRDSARRHVRPVPAISASLGRAGCGSRRPSLSAPRPAQPRGGAAVACLAPSNAQRAAEPTPAATRSTCVNRSMDTTRTSRSTRSTPRARTTHKTPRAPSCAHLRRRRDSQATCSRTRARWRPSYDLVFVSIATANPVGEIATESMSPCPRHCTECRSRQPSACSGASARWTASSERAPTVLRRSQGKPMAGVHPESECYEKHEPPSDGAPVPTSAAATRMATPPAAAPAAALDSAGTAAARVVQHAASSPIASMPLIVAPASDVSPAPTPRGTPPRQRERRTAGRATPGRGVRRYPCFVPNRREFVPLTRSRAHIHRYCRVSASGNGTGASSVG